MKMVIAIACALMMCAPLTACGGDTPPDSQVEVQEDEQKSAAEELVTTAMAASLVCEDYLNGELGHDIALGILEDYEEEADDLSDRAADDGVYTSVDLYIGQMRATLESWDKLEAVGDDPEGQLRTLMEELNAEIVELDDDI